MLRVHVYTDPFPGNSLGELRSLPALAVDFDFKYQNWRITLPDNTVTKHTIGDLVDGHKVTDVAVRPW